MNSTQHNESLEGVLGEKRPGRGGRAPVWGLLWLVDLRGAPGILGKVTFGGHRCPRHNVMFCMQASGTSFQEVLSLEQFSFPANLTIKEGTTCV